MTKATSPDKNTAYNPDNYPAVGVDGHPLVNQPPVPSDPADNVKVPNPPATAKSARENKDILGASKEALGGDRKSLTETTPKKIGEVQPPQVTEPFTMAQINSPENLANNALVSDARGFLRAKGIADHLYTDAVAIAEFVKYRDSVGKGLAPDYQPKMPVPATTHFNTPTTASVAPSLSEAVTRAEFSTTTGDVVPHYLDPEEGKDADRKARNTPT